MGRTSPTLRRAWPKDGPLAAICVQSVDVQCVLQFTLIHAAGCVLHRRTSRVIHRLKLFFVIFRLHRSSRDSTRQAESLQRPVSPLLLGVFIAFVSRNEKKKLRKKSGRPPRLDGGLFKPSPRRTEDDGGGEVVGFPCRTCRKLCLVEKRARHPHRIGTPKSQFSGGGPAKALVSAPPVAPPRYVAAGLNGVAPGARRERLGKKNLSVRDRDRQTGGSGRGPKPWEEGRALHEPAKL